MGRAVEDGHREGGPVGGGFVGCLLDARLQSAEPRTGEQCLRWPGRRDGVQQQSDRLRWRR